MKEVEKLIERLEKITNTKVIIKEDVGRSIKKKFYTATSGFETYSKRVESFLKFIEKEHPDLEIERKEFSNLMEKIEDVFSNIEMYLNKKEIDKQKGTPFHVLS